VNLSLPKTCASMAVVNTYIGRWWWSVLWFSVGESFADHHEFYRVALLCSLCGGGILGSLGDRPVGVVHSVLRLARLCALGHTTTENSKQLRADKV
jgi:hypothetical protein